MNARSTTWLAWSLDLLCTALAAGSLLFGALNGITPYAMLTHEQGLFTVATLVVAFALVGAPLAAHRPRNPPFWHVSRLQPMNVAWEHARSQR